MSFDSTMTADDTDVDQQQARKLLQLICFTVDGHLADRTVTVLSSYSKAFAQAAALDNGIISSETSHLAIGEVLIALQTNHVGNLVASTLTHQQLISIATPVFAERLPFVPGQGREIAVRLGREQLEPTAEHVFDECLARAIRMTRKQRLIEKFKQQLEKAFADTRSSRSKKFIRLVLEKFTQLADEFVNDPQFEETDVLFVFASATQAAFIEMALSEFGRHFGFPEEHGSFFDQPHDEHTSSHPHGHGDLFPHVRRSAFAHGFPTDGVIIVSGHGHESALFGPHGQHGAV